MKIFYTQLVYVFTHDHNLFVSFSASIFPHHRVLVFTCYMQHLLTHPPGVLYICEIYLSTYRRVCLRRRQLWRRLRLWLWLSKCFNVNLYTKRKLSVRWQLFNWRPKKYFDHLIPIRNPTARGFLVCSSAQNVQFQKQVCSSYSKIVQFLIQSIGQIWRIQLIFQIIFAKYKYFREKLHLYHQNCLKLAFDSILGYKCEVSRWRCAVD